MGRFQWGLARRGPFELRHREDNYGVTEPCQSVNGERKEKCSQEVFKRLSQSLVTVCVCVCVCVCEAGGKTQTRPVNCPRELGSWERVERERVWEIGEREIRGLKRGLQSLSGLKRGHP